MTKTWALVAACVAALSAIPATSHGFRTFVCADGKCRKDEAKSEADVTSIGECKILCLEDAALWPKPYEMTNASKALTTFDPARIAFKKYALPAEMLRLVEAAQDAFIERVRVKSRGRQASPGGFALEVHLEVYDPTNTYFKTFENESYKLKLKTAPETSTVEAKIEATTFFGMRHGLETLAQLIVFNDAQKMYKILSGTQIRDRPEFTYRGLLLDTGRSYISVDNIKKTLDLMAMNKMNTFHWHITDTQSFPYVSVAYPELSRSGAYSDEEVYTQDDVKSIVEFARVRGIRVVPEFDAPAHVGEGWNALGDGLVTCFNKKPWNKFCVEPPCGQLNPIDERVYEILGTLFKEYASLFPSDMFHMGGDEVSEKCWFQTPDVEKWMKEKKYKSDTAGFHQLWLHFQAKAFEKLKQARSDPHPKPLLWTSSLTAMQDAEKHLRPQEYIIQVWTNRSSHEIADLLRKGYQIILSNYDELYLDCGGPSWVNAHSENWCAPYKGWQDVYHHSPMTIAENLKIRDRKTKKQILGSEAAVWTEQIDDATVMPRTWPRTAALAERLWSNPPTNWRDAKFRFLHHTERMNEVVREQDRIQPKWCYHHDGDCPPPA